MGTLITDFADQLFSFIALKYEIVSIRNLSENAPPIEDYDWPSELFSIDIGHAVMMLSYTYRSAFRRHFKSVSQIICSSRETAKMYPVIFAKVTYKCHSPLKILVIFAFISEMYLYMYFRSSSANASRLYTIPCINCFINIYKSVLRKIDDPLPKWNDVKQAASLVAEGYSIMEPIMNTEHPSQNKLFFKSIQDVLIAKGKTYYPDDYTEDFCVPATSEPPTSANTSNASATKTKYIGGSQRLRSGTTNTTTRVTKRRISQASATNVSASKSNTNPKDKSKQDGKKILSGGSVGERQASTISFGTVDQITSKIPGFNEQKAASLEYDHLKDKSPKDSNAESKDSSASSRGKARSKKHKSRKNSKK